MTASVRINLAAALAMFLALFSAETGECFHLVMMGARRGKGSLENVLKGRSSSTKKSRGIPNQGRGQEITGVTLPENRSIKGWEFGNSTRLAATSVDGRYYALQGECPRCGFDLWKGDLITSEDAGFINHEPPLVACPTCSSTFSFRSGKFGPVYQRQGLRAFVGNLAKAATSGEAGANAKAFIVTKDDEDGGRVFLRERL
jgi:nitrite reductase/ring-hydroxylating ferredoxin subunit